jgi:hypothetical protein
VIPAPRPTFYAYVVVDVTAPDVKPIAVKLSRGEARKDIEWREDADNLRIRRARVSLYTS